MNEFLKKYIKYLIIFIIVVCGKGSSSIAVILGEDVKHIDSNSKRGAIIMQELLIAHEILAKTKLSDITSKKKIVNSMVSLNSGKYEIVFFEFRNITDKAFSSDKSFEEFVKDNNLLYMRSSPSSSEKEKSLEIFDSSEANIDNEVFFNISLTRAED